MCHTERSRSAINNIVLQGIQNLVGFLILNLQETTVKKELAEMSNKSKL